MNKKGFITYDSQDGRTTAYDERPYVRGFIHKNLYKQFSKNLLKLNPNFRIVNHLPDKNLRTNDKLYIVLEDRTRRRQPYEKRSDYTLSVRKYYSSSLPNYITNTLFPTYKIDLDNCYIITCLDLEWTHNVKEPNGLFHCICESLPLELPENI